MVDGACCCALVVVVVVVVVEDDIDDDEEDLPVAFIFLSLMYRVLYSCIVYSSSTTDRYYVLIYLCTVHYQYQYNVQ